MSVSFLDLRPAHTPLRDELLGAIRRVMMANRYILGPEVEAFEREFARFCGTGHCVGVGNGMQAIELILRGLGVGPGDEVVTVSHTAFPTVAAIMATGATPVFVDVHERSFCMQPSALLDSFSDRTRAVLPVHLYGRCADMESICELSAEAGIPVVEDAAQAHGATDKGRRAGTMGAAAAFSFYPTKNLGALGDAGAVVTSDSDLALKVRQLRNYGETSRYVNVTSGYNSRLDEIQAAVLRVKLPHLERWTAERRAIASLYDGLLSGSDVVSPEGTEGHVYHLYVVRSGARDRLREHLRSHAIGSDVHYPTPVHAQPAFRDAGMRQVGGLPTTERLQDEILSLPAYPGMTREQVEEVAEAVRSFGG